MGTVPAIEAAFPLWTAIPIDWNKKDVDRFSAVVSQDYEFTHTLFSTNIFSPVLP